MVFRLFSSSSLTIPKTPATIGVIVALTSHNFSTCNLKFWYLVIFSISFNLMFWSPGTAMLMILHSLFPLSMTTISGFQCSISLSVWIAKSQSIGSSWCENHLSLHSISTFLHRRQYTFFSKFVVSLPVLFSSQRTELELTIWETISTVSLQNLHSRDTSWRSMSFFVAFVLSACSWAGHTRLLVSLFRSSAFSQCYLIWPCIPSVSLRHCPCNAFTFHAACLSFSRCSLFFPSAFVLSCNSSFGASRNLSLLFAA